MNDILKEKKTNMILHHTSTLAIEN